MAGAGVRGIGDKPWTKDRTKGSDTMAVSMVSSLKTPVLTAKRIYQFYREEVALWQVITEVSGDKQAIWLAYALPDDHPNGLKDKVMGASLGADKLKGADGVKNLLAFLDTMYDKDATNLLKERMTSMKKVAGEEGTGDPDLEVAEQQEDEQHEAKEETNGTFGESGGSGEYEQQEGKHEVEQHEAEEAINVPCNKLEEVDLAGWTIVDGRRRGRRRGWRAKSRRQVKQYEDEYEGKQ